MRMFRNDYSEGAAPEVLQALIDTNEEQCPGYTEGDVHCERARALIRDAVGLPDAAVEFCVGATSVNLIAVTGMPAGPSFSQTIRMASSPPMRLSASMGARWLAQGT